MTENRRKKKTSQFAVLCRLMPIFGGVLAILIGLPILVNALNSDGELLDGESLVAILTARIWIQPIESAAEEFPELDIQEDYLTVNEYSRPGIELTEVRQIVVHYTGNPGTTAQANRNYFESLAENPITYASSHFVIGMDGEIIQCVPLNEIAYASNKANGYSLSIECCHPDAGGEFTTETYNRCVTLVAELCNYYHLDPETDVIRHYDVTGKECPLYYVENPEEWEMFLGFVKERVDELDR